MALLELAQASGVTATAHKWEGNQIELDVLQKFNFKVFALFPEGDLPEVEDMNGKTYNDLMTTLLKPELKQYTTLMIGRIEDIKRFVKEEFETLVPVVSSDGRVKMLLD